MRDVQSNIGSDQFYHYKTIEYVNDDMEELYDGTLITKPKKDRHFLDDWEPELDDEDDIVPQILLQDQDDEWETKSLNV